MSHLAAQVQDLFEQLPQTKISCLAAPVQDLSEQIPCTQISLQAISQQQLPLLLLDHFL